MTSRKRARGRPKGTGIDDRERLVAMALQLSANPGMRPTTAIKAIGITDQSAIRRLRDKYRRACQNGSIDGIATAGVAPSARLRPANDDVKAELSETAQMQHYALALQSSVVAVQHRISGSRGRPDDLALRELLDQQFHLSNVLLGLISQSRPPATHPH
ncbi:MAG: hypothetical protein RLZ98_397 [Pseudomonadota bacterium]|jgi:hypothetical protein